MKTLFF